jgi:CheY-like chemotaxis protein
LAISKQLIEMMGGFEATAALRRKELAAGCSKPVVIVALTAHAFDENRERCRDAGMDDFLSKPFDRQGRHEILACWLVEKAPVTVPVTVPRVGGVV